MLIKGVKPEVGMEVVIANSNQQSYTAYRFGYFIEKITPTGQITVARADGNKKRFDNQGWEYGAGLKWSRDWLEFDVAGLKKTVRDRKVVAEAVKHINLANARAYLPYAVSRQIVQERINFMQSCLDEARKILEEKPR